MVGYGKEAASRLKGPSVEVRRVESWGGDLERGQPAPPTR